VEKAFRTFPYSKFESMLITPDSFPISVPFAASVVDLFRPELVVEVEICGASAWELNILDGLIVLRGGERRRLTIRGKAGYCEAVIQRMQAELGGGTVRFIS
jgi:hypothetical protein